MSIEAIDWLLRGRDDKGRPVELPTVPNVSAAGVFAVLLVLAEHADPHGVNSYPTQRTIAEESRVPRSQVQEVLRVCRDAGRIVKTAEGIPRRKGDTYDLRLHVFALGGDLDQDQDQVQDQDQDRHQDQDQDHTLGPEPEPEPKPEPEEPPASSLDAASVLETIASMGDDFVALNADRRQLLVSEWIADAGDQMGISELSVFTKPKERKDLAEAERCLLDALRIEDPSTVEVEFFGIDFPDEPSFSATGLIRERARRTLAAIERSLSDRTLAARRRAS